MLLLFSSRIIVTLSWFRIETILMDVISLQDRSSCWFDSRLDTNLLTPLNRDAFVNCFSYLYSNNVLSLKRIQSAFFSYFVMSRLLNRIYWIYSSRVNNYSLLLRTIILSSDESLYFLLWIVFVSSCCFTHTNFSTRCLYFLYFWV